MIVLAPELIEAMLVEFAILVPVISSPTFNPTTLSTVRTVAPDVAEAVNVNTVVGSPNSIVGSLTDIEALLTVVVVPSICRSPLIITKPSASPPAGNGSMIISVPEVVERILPSIFNWSIVNSPVWLIVPETVCVPLNVTPFSNVVVELTVSVSVLAVPIVVSSSTFKSLIHALAPTAKPPDTITAAVVELDAVVVSANVT